MRWKRGSRSRNIEDRRGQRATRRFPGFPMGRSRARAGGAGLPLGGGKMGLGTIVILLLVMWFLGGDLSSLLGSGAGLPSGAGLELPNPPVGAGRAGAAPRSSAPGEEELVDFVSFVLDDVQNTWKQLLPGYRDASLVLFRDSTRSGCGVGQAEMGPFYCPADQKVYIDLGFYGDLRARFGAPGDFAQAYVLAHEIGHHVQKLTGIEGKVRQEQRARPRDANRLSVAIELQADCLSGVWAHSTAERGILEKGDVEEGLNAAAAVGDDRIQKMGRGRVSPESFTHGSSAQRVEWFRRGLESGDVDGCNTFGR